MRVAFRNKVTTGIILILLCLAAAYFLATPLWKKYSANQDQLKLANGQAAQLGQAIAQIDSFISSYNANSSDVGVAQSALPAGHADSANFVSSLASLAQASGIVLADLQLQEEGAADRQAPHVIQPIQVNLQANGTYASFEDFILRLENHLRISDVQKVTLSAQESGLLHYQLTFKIYYQR